MLEVAWACSFFGVWEYSTALESSAFIILEKIFVNWRMINIENTAIERLEMPFWLKLNLTKQEAAAYSNIGINRIEDMLKNPKCPFVLYVGTKKLVKRKEFEQYIAKSLEI